MRRYSPNHPAVIAYRKTHPPKPMSLRRKTTILLLLTGAVITTPWWYLSVTCTLTAWHIIKRYYDQP